MGLTVWPPPPTEEQLQARRAAGARTFRELDPAFAKWLDQTDRTQRIQKITIFIGILGLICIFMWAMLARL